ncbi:gamma-glutamylcyclotransferase [Alphaproteobacteria bacterium]|nr:gamma-glutamylcyclotransferase [Alphaproteobacteria bacterium]
METVFSKDEVWVFGYGSLMWRPGFDFIQSSVAHLRGYHRHFCVWSHRYRGSPKVPGLVLGLDWGGSCRGVAYRIAPDQAENVLVYLHEREMITGVYRPSRLSMTLVDGGGAGVEASLSRQRVVAQTYVVDRTHPQYAGTLSETELAALIIQGVGTAGPCLDYLNKTINYLVKMGIPDRRLEKMLALVDAMLVGREPIPKAPSGPPPHAANLHRF